MRWALILVGVCVPTLALAEEGEAEVPTRVVALQAGVMRLSGEFTPTAIELSLERGRKRIFHMGVDYLTGDDATGVALDLGIGYRHTEGAADVALIGGVSGNVAVIPDSVTAAFGPFIGLRVSAWLTDRVAITVTGIGRFAIVAPEDRLLGSVTGGLATRF